MQPTATKLKIAIVDDHNLFRKGLIKVINLSDKGEKYSVLFEAENGNDFKEKLNKNLLPDIILMDIDMPDMDGYETVAWLRTHYPDISILVVSMVESEESIIRMVRLGVQGYLSKDIEVEDMQNALESISNKRSYYSDVVSAIMADNIRRGMDKTNRGKEHENWRLLSEKELEFIKLACTELTYQQIADKMNLSAKTIEGYRESTFNKLVVKNRVGLVIYAIKTGIVKL